jgi:hypothetical protein
MSPLYPLSRIQIDVELLLLLGVELGRKGGILPGGL